MTKFSVMPDIPEEYVRYQDNRQDLMIFNNNFIKREYQSDVNIEVLEKLMGLQIPHFLFPEKILVDDYNMFYFMVSKYLYNHHELTEKLKTMSSKEIVLLFKKMLLSLKNAHEQGFNPFEITYLNYLIDDNNEPTFIDVGDSFYEGKPTSKYITKTIFDISFFHKNNQDFSLDNLILNDKMCLLAMLLQSLIGKYQVYGTPEDLINISHKFNKWEILTNNILRYLENMIYKREAPQKDDYFIDDLIDPLLSTLERKR